MKKITHIMFFLIFLISCTSNTSEEQDYPSCLESKVQSVLSSPVKSKKPKIDKYSYQNKVVYIFFDNYYDDASYSVIDENCNEVCRTSGGWSATTCSNLNDLIFVETIWEDPR